MFECFMQSITVMDGEGKLQLEKQFTEILQPYLCHLTLLITWSSWSQNIFQLQKTNGSLNTPLCLTALTLIESIQCLLYTIYFSAFSFITNIITTITPSHMLINIYNLLLLMSPEFYFAPQCYYNIPIPQWEKWNLQLYFQRWGLKNAWLQMAETWVHFGPCCKSHQLHLSNLWKTAQNIFHSGKSLANYPFILYVLLVLNRLKDLPAST